MTKSDREIAFLVAVRTLLKVRPRMPLRCVETLLLVSLYPGESVSDLARRAKLSISTMSRNLHDIGDETRKGDPGLGLVLSNGSLDNSNTCAYVLSPKGRMLIDTVMGVLA